MRQHTLRLMVRPGITGWAQINGGDLVSTEEKGALDDWYVKNASFWLDPRIAFYTLMFLFTGERRFEQAVQEAAAPAKGNGHAATPEEGKPADIREIAAARHQLSPMFPVKVFPAKASPQRLLQRPLNQIQSTVRNLRL